MKLADDIQHSNASVVDHAVAQVEDGLQWSLLLRCRHSEEVAIRLHRRFESLVLGFRQSIE